MVDNMRIAGIVEESVVDGPGIRLAVFFQGCPHACPGCHNPKTHDFLGGTEMPLEKIVEYMDNPLLDGITLTGGEPFCQPKDAYLIAKEAHKRGLDVFTYTGYTIEQITEKNDSDMMTLLKISDMLVDGPFILAKRTLDIPFVGSSNQRIINIKQYFENRD